MATLRGGSRASPMYRAMSKQSEQRFRRFLAGATTAAVVLAAAAAALTISGLREQAIENAETSLKNTSLVLAEQTARTVQAVDLVLQEAIERFRRRPISGPESF